MSDRTVTFSELASEGLIEVGAGRPRSVVDQYPSIPILRVADVLDGRIESPPQGEVSDSYQEAIGSKISRPGDVVLTVKGTVGRVAIMPHEGPVFAYSPQLCYFRPAIDGPLRSRYLYYWFKSRQFWNQADALKGQTDMADYLSLADVQALRIRVPSIDRQDGVIGILGSLDDKIAVNELIAETSRELMVSRYTAATASGAHKRKIGDLADLFDGPHATPVKTEAGPWFLSISSLSNGRLIFLEESAHLAEEDFAKWTRRVAPQPGDVLFSYETRLGEAALMPRGIRACLGRRMALLRPHSVGSLTLLQAFLHPSFQETIRQYSYYGATVDRIPLTEFPSWQIELPSKNTERLESVLISLSEVIEQRERENRTLAVIRDTLLPRLISGEIRVRDAEKALEDVT